MGALGESYASLDELKDYLKIPTTKQLHDQALTDALESASAEIERHCNRQFNKQTTTTARVYSPDTYDRVWVDDFHTTTGLVVTNDGAVLDSSDYELYPLNGVSDGQPGWPFWKIKLKQGNRFVCRNGEATVSVTAQWGWAAVPAPIRQACLIMAAETFQLKDAPFGVAGMDTFGTVLRVRDNKMAETKTSRYCRNRFLVG